MNTFLLNLFSLLAILSGILVITSKNPVVSVIFLISLFVNTSIYLILLGVSFVGISYIIIYIGAITVLFLFIIMMLCIYLLDILEIGKEYTKNLPLALIVGFLFIFEIFSIIPFSINDISSFPNSILEIIYKAINFLMFSNEFIFNLSPSTVYSVYTLTECSTIFISFFSYNSPEIIIREFTQISSLGQGLYTHGSVWLLICSLILLLAMFSAIILSQSNYRQSNKE